MKIRIIDTKSPYCGQEFDGHLVYYDYYHGKKVNGRIQDLFSVEIDGKTEYFLTNQIDYEYFNRQRQQKVIDRLGAEEGDEVRVIESGSGSFASYFGKRDTHIVRRIVETGNIYFDDGVTSIFNPVVEVVKKAVSLNERQIHIMRHAIGLYDYQPLPKPRIHKCFRNRYMTEEPDADWSVLVKEGFATELQESGWWYSVTRAGMNYLEYLLGVRIINEE